MYNDITHWMSLVSVEVGTSLISFVSLSLASHSHHPSNYPLISALRPLQHSSSIYNPYHSDIYNPLSVLVRAKISCLVVSPELLQSTGSKPFNHVA